MTTSISANKAKLTQRRSKRVLELTNQLENLRKELVADGCSLQVEFKLQAAKDKLSDLRYAIDTDS